MPDQSATPPFAPGDPSLVDDDPQPLSMGRRLARALIIVVALSIAGLWAYALWGPVQRSPQGRLDSTAFPTQAEPVCVETMLRLDELPQAFETRDSAARADVIAQANAELAIMLDRLTEIAPPAGTDDDARMIQEWLGDWRTFLGDRQDYVQRLASDPEARMLVSEKENGQVTKPIDYFAGVNDMKNCATPGDLA
jgi:hypothetical protein